MRRVPTILLFALLCVAIGAEDQTRAETPALRLGIMPFAPPEVILRQFGHLKDYLESALGRHVAILSANDYGSFATRLLDDSYDVVFTAPHLGLLGQSRGRWRPLVRSGIQVKAVLLVRSDRKFASVQDLRGKLVATPDPLALVTFIAEEELAKLRLRPGAALTVTHTPSHETAMLLAARGLVDAAVTVPILLERLPLSTRRQLVVLHTFPERFALVYMASTRLDAPVQSRLQTLLLAFPDSPQGQAFFSVGTPQRYFPLDEAALQLYAPMLPSLLERVQQASAE